MKLFNFFKSKCTTSDDQAHTIDNVYPTLKHAENNVEKLQDKSDAAKQYLGEKHILHPNNAVKRLKKVKHLTLEITNMNMNTFFPPNVTNTGTLHDLQSEFPIRDHFAALAMQADAMMKERAK